MRRTVGSYCPFPRRIPQISSRDNLADNAIRGGLGLFDGTPKSMVEVLERGGGFEDRGGGGAFYLRSRFGGGRGCDYGWLVLGVWVGG